MQLLLGLCLSLLAADDLASTVRYEASEIHMGTRFHVILYASDPQAAQTALRATFARIGQLDEMLSDYRSHSELNRLSRTAPSDRFVPVSSELFEVLRFAQSVSRHSDGAFDVTVGPLTRLWRRARRKKRLPTNANLAKARAAVDFRAVRLDVAHTSIQLMRPRMRLDLGGIAKGYAVDEALRCLREHRIQRALVDGGGDIAVGEPPPGKIAWAIAVAELDPDAVPRRFLKLRNQAVATSGDARQFVEIDGRRYSHIVDPRTGLGLPHRSRVTVVAGNGALSDSLASAVSVLGPERGLSLVERLPGIEAQVTTLREQQLTDLESSGFRRLADVADHERPARKQEAAGADAGPR